MFVKTKITVLGLSVCAVFLGGCGPKYSKLKTKSAKEIKLDLAAGGLWYCARHLPPQLRVQVRYENGEVVKTWQRNQPRRGTLKFKNFQWRTNFGEVDISRGVLRLPADHLAWMNKPAKVAVKIPGRDDLQTEALLRPRYDCGGTVYVQGDDGSHGSRGTDGGAGADGPDVDVALAYVANNDKRLIVVRVRSSNLSEPRTFLTSATPKNFFYVDASGGDGGIGGMGQAGYNGKDGKSGVRGRCNGQDGYEGGPGGNGSNGGNGGNIVVRYDAAHPELPTLVRFVANGGKPGQAGTGGNGGSGGYGGKGCRNGLNGRKGRRGPDGVDGQPGYGGQPGSIREVPTPVGQLFPEEIKRGVIIVRN